MEDYLIIPVNGGCWIDTKNGIHLDFLIENTPVKIVFKIFEEPELTIRYTISNLGDEPFEVEYRYVTDIGYFDDLVKRGEGVLVENATLLQIREDATVDEETELQTGRIKTKVRSGTVLVPRQGYFFRFYVDTSKVHIDYQKISDLQLGYSFRTDDPDEYVEIKYEEEHNIVLVGLMLMEDFLNHETERRNFIKAVTNNEN